MLGRHPRSPFLWPGPRLGCWSRGALPASSPASRPHPTRGSFLAGAHLLRPRPQVLPCPALPCPPLYWAPRAAQDHQGAGAAAVCPTGSLGLISAVLGSCQRPLQDRDLSAVPSSRSVAGGRFPCCCGLSRLNPGNVSPSRPFKGALMPPLKSKVCKVRMMVG